VKQENVLVMVLKNPGRVAAEISSGQAAWQSAVLLAGWGLVLHAVYGIAMGLFDSGTVALLAACKAPLIAACALLLCLPSLYVFSCVAGVPITVRQACALAGTVLAMTGLLLLGLTPVAWLFSVSTSNLGFVVIMNVTAWMISLVFVFRFFRLLKAGEQQPSAGGLRWWLAVYVIVSLQMTTTMRPLLRPPESGWRDTQKQFFLAHFAECLKGAE